MPRLPRLDAIAPQSRTTPFDGEDWLFEIKYDGFRAMAYVQDGRCEFVSRNKHVYKRFASLAEKVASLVLADDCILDGEIVFLDDQGHAVFSDLMHNRGTPIFAAFDMVWVNGKDIRDKPLTQRKEMLEIVFEGVETDLLYVSHIPEQGKLLFKEACARDLEGIVAKPAISPYRLIDGKAPWIKVKNPAYSQAEGWGELFNKQR